MTTPDPEELQATQEIRRAAVLVALAQGRSVDESAELLRFRAGVQGRSLHAVALAVLFSEPTDELLLALSARSAPARAPTQEHLAARRYAAVDEATTSMHEVDPVPRRGRHRAR